LFLEIFTLLLLAGVLAVKYATTAHTVKLQQKLAEATNLAQRNQERHKRLQMERQAVEAEEAHTQNQKRVLDEHLDTMSHELKEQETKNKDLAERIEKAKQ
jgi:hypothetical protein